MVVTARLGSVTFTTAQRIVFKGERLRTIVQDTTEDIYERATMSPSWAEVALAAPGRNRQDGLSPR